jgi:hypothetical protein
MPEAGVHGADGCGRDDAEPLDEIEAGTVETA